MKFLFALFLLVSLSFAQEKIKVGVLAFGTVNWELDVMKTNNIAKKNGLDLEVIKLASKNAVSIALKAGAVDVIVSDFIWVSRQRASGYEFTFYPYSKAIGALYVRPELNINSLEDLQDKSIGIAGGPVDKTWLLLQAYSSHKYQKNLKDFIVPTFASPVILNRKVLDNSLDGAINFWHFGAKLQAAGMQKLIGLENILKEFDIHSDVSFLGWVFSDKFAKNNPKTISAFLESSYESKQLLNNSDQEWNRLRPLMKVKNDKSFEALKKGYKEGIVKNFSKQNREDAKKVFNILAKEGGTKLIGRSQELQEGTFYPFTPKVQW